MKKTIEELIQHEYAILSLQYKEEVNNKKMEVINTIENLIKYNGEEIDSLDNQFELLCTKLSTCEGDILNKYRMKMLEKVELIIRNYNTYMHETIDNLTFNVLELDCVEIKSFLEQDCINKNLNEEELKLVKQDKKNIQKEIEVEEEELKFIKKDEKNCRKEQYEKEKILKYEQQEQMKKEIEELNHQNQMKKEIEELNRQEQMKKEIEELNRQEQIKKEIEELNRQEQMKKELARNEENLLQRNRTAKNLKNQKIEIEEAIPKLIDETNDIWQDESDLDIILQELLKEIEDIN